MKKILIYFLGQNKYTILSLLVILGMFGIFTTVYNPDGTVRQMAQTIASAKAQNSSASVGGPFEMVDYNGQPFTQENLKGKYSLIFFGYTFCPDICPMALSLVADVYEKLPDYTRDNLQTIMVTVDPARDTAQVMKDYTTAFNDQFLGLTGTEEQVRQMANAYKVYYAKLGEGEDYTVSHSGFLYLMGPDGAYVAHFGHDDTPETLYAGLTKYINK